MRRLRAAARSEAAAVAPTVAPGMRGVGLQPPVDRAARAGAPTSATTAGISSARGRNRAQKARVRGLGAGTHLHGRPKEALPPPMGQVAGGAPPPDAKTAFWAATTVWQQPGRSGQRAGGPSTCPLHQLGGAMADETGALLCTLNEQVEDVILAHCDAASSTTRGAEGLRRVVQMTP